MMNSISLATEPTKNNEEYTPHLTEEELDYISLYHTLCDQIAY